MKADLCTFKKSLIQTRKNFCHTEKLNPKNIGWIRPDGIISFQTSEAAESYAKNRCVSALNSAKPFERGIVVKDNKILAEVQGGVTQVDMSEYSGIMAGTAFYHGHVRVRGNMELPLSLADYLAMLTHHVKKVVAINKDGEHSTLIQKPQKNRFLKLFPKEWQNIIMEGKRVSCGRLALSEFGKEYAKLFPKNLQKKMECALHAKFGIIYGNNNKIKNFYEKEKNFSFEESLEVDSVAKQITEDGALAEMINNFWIKISKKLNCIYSTDFAGLTKK